jgi:hypothetical protein
LAIGSCAARAVAWHCRDASPIGQRTSIPADLTVVRGVVGSEKKAFFSDPEVKRIFALSGLSVEVDTAGSREIATSTDLKAYDFASPASAPAAEKIKREHKTLGVYSPFYSPIAIASFQPIVDLLQRAGVAKKAPTGHLTFDVNANLKLVEKGTRWDQLPGNTAYPASKAVLLTTNREVVSLLGYSDTPRRPQVFRIPASGSRKVLADIRGAARDLEPSGYTATYSALRAAYRLAAKQTAARPGALTTIVLMTDGETNRGATARQFRSYYRDLPPAARAVPTFTVKFGPADPRALSAVSELTGGKLFVVRDTRLARAFKEIRAYQ